jgi:ISXO2-like transposase domain
MPAARFRGDASHVRDDIKCNRSDCRLLRRTSASHWQTGTADVTTNSVEGFFGIFKRCMVGVHQHCGEQHLQRCLDEFSFRYNNRVRHGVEDEERAVLAAKGMDGKRLTYRRTDAA